MTIIFVYGSLIQGEPNHGLLSRARFVGNATTVKRYTLYDLGTFPAMVRTGTSAVRGELYEVNDFTLAIVDRLEGVPSFYRRIAVSLDDGSVADGYVLGHDLVYGRRVVASGDWRRRNDSQGQCGNDRKARVQRGRGSGAWRSRV